MTEQKRYYTTIEASKLLGTSVRTIQLWVESGDLDAWKTAGGHRRIRVESVQQKLKEQDPTSASEAESEKKPKRILVVEDNPTVSIFYKAAIDSWGLPVEVTTAEDGFQGLVKIGEVKPDLIITDIYMPGMDGLQMIQSLYKSKLLETDRLILISGLSVDEIRERGGIPSGVQFFKKPVDVELLRDTVIKKLSLTIND